MQQRDSNGSDPEESPSPPHLDLGRIPWKSWPGSIHLFREEDGTYRAEPGGEIAQRKLLLQWKITPQERDVFLALALIAEEADLGISSLVFSKLQSALGKEIHTLLHDEEASEPKRRAAKSSILNRIETAVDVLARRAQREPHGRARSLQFLSKRGSLISGTLGYLLIDYCCEMVAATQDLPSKHDLKERIIADYPEARKIIPATWSKALSEAGLAKLLPRKGAW